MERLGVSVHGSQRRLYLQADQGVGTGSAQRLLEVGACCRGVAEPAVKHAQIAALARGVTGVEAPHLGQRLGLHPETRFNVTMLVPATQGVVYLSSQPVRAVGREELHGALELGQRVIEALPADVDEECVRQEAPGALRAYLVEKRLGLLDGSGGCRGVGEGLSPAELP